MFFIDNLIKKINDKKSHVAVGLDPDYESLPKSVKNINDCSLKDASSAIIKFNIEIIDSICDLVPAVKPQIAFYERYGIDGMKAFMKTVKHARRRGLIVVEDAKRNDIGSTATAYSEGHIGKVRINNTFTSVFDVDAITVNPYLGTDGILPFITSIKENAKGIFVLVKTSNPSSVDLQDVNVSGTKHREKLHQLVAKLVNQWGQNVIGDSGYSSVGAVVGATFPEDAKILRKLMPRSYFLVPGYGTQGGTASDIIHCFNKDGHGALIAASRSINYAYKRSKRYRNGRFGKAAREAVIEMNRDINDALDEAGLLKF
jgi:orotidine-5'-phosphate decarboxylase